MLELERMKRLNAKARIIQRVLRGYRYRYHSKALHFLFSVVMLPESPHRLQERVPEEKSQCCGHSEALERTQRPKAAPSGEN